MSKPPIRHFDQARQEVLQNLRQLLQQEMISRAVVSPDIFARIRVILWDKQSSPSLAQRATLEEGLVAAAGPFWGGLWLATAATPMVDREMLQLLWDEGVPDVTTEQIRLNERYRNLEVWLKKPFRPPWSANPEVPQGPPIISFYAFKGGMGRSTALAIFAAQRAQVGERVVVIDLDLAAPGVSVLLGDPMVAVGGVVDYWLEQPLVGENVDLRDYYYRVNNQEVTGRGEILVFPAGHFNDLYPIKLSRLDFTRPDSGQHPLETLLQQIHHELHPNWILLDARAGISEVSGFVFGGLAHLNILFGGTSEASWRGLRLAIQRLGAARALARQPQAECLLVHSMVPANPETAHLAQQNFLRQAETIFEETYYLADPDNPDEDIFWYIRDMQNNDAPHVPVSLAYSDKIAFFTQLTTLTNYGLNASDYQEFAKRITNRFAKTTP